MLSSVPRKSPVEKAPRKEPTQLAELATRLRQAGLRRTAPRVAVLQRLAAAKEPMSHAAIADELAHLGIDRATIYRNLMDLTDVGLISRNDLGDHVWRFELISGSRDHKKVHPHLVCNDCGTVSCLTDVEIKLVVARGASTKLREQELEVQLRGLCAECG